ncbi:hypothetical protein [Paenibacillus taiwanensis]|uniref:hypothetical protein n=1 Tax=Paenibacillus taiwanensis TaxID=401638 RepID=UPI0004098955|nr:hypothetical protein [Paenibacillus taiwanensis]
MKINDESFYEETNSKDQAVAHLIKAIALEEEALSKLINTEADKALAFVGKNLDFPTGPSTSEIIQFNHTVIQLLDTMLMAEWLLLKKLDTLSFVHDYRSISRSEEGRKHEASYQDDVFDY